MTRILDDREYENWIHSFSPALFDLNAESFVPAIVTDRSDPKIVHLDGLNFSRAWCLFHISEKLQGEYPELSLLARKHLDNSLPFITSGNYEGEHWLASFALYAIDAGSE